METNKPGLVQKAESFRDEMDRIKLYIASFRDKISNQIGRLFCSDVIVK